MLTDGLLIVSLLIEIALGGQVGIATWYSTEHHEGNPLYCDFAFPGVDLIYSRETADREGPWVAVNIRQYREGRIECGQKVLLIFSDGPMFVARALDAGPFDGYYVEDYGPNIPIVVDVPEYWRADVDMERSLSKLVYLIPGSD